jgi:hypothetical protein
MKIINNILTHNLFIIIIWIFIIIFVNNPSILYNTFLLKFVNNPLFIFIILWIISYENNYNYCLDKSLMLFLLFVFIINIANINIIKFFYNNSSKNENNLEIERIESILNNNNKKNNNKKNNNKKNNKDNKDNNIDKTDKDNNRGDNSDLYDNIIINPNQQILNNQYDNTIQKLYNSFDENHNFCKL